MGATNSGRSVLSSAFEPAKTISVVCEFNTEGVVSTDTFDTYLKSVDEAPRPALIRNIFG
jgi:hypothetical protein